LTVAILVFFILVLGLTAFFLRFLLLLAGLLPALLALSVLPGLTTLLPLSGLSALSFSFQIVCHE